MARRRKQERVEKKKPSFRVNENIRIPEVRLVGENIEAISKAIGEEIAPGNVYKTRKVQDWARKAELDLVEISPNANPPVVRIVDFYKFL